MKEQKIGTIAHIGAGKTGLVAALDLMMSHPVEAYVIPIVYQKREEIPMHNLIKVEPFRGRIRKKKGRR
jgi:translation elongation factor EF-Tu-like GTPase